MQNLNITELRVFLTERRVYSPTKIDNVLKRVRPFFRFSYTNRKLKYFNVPCSFDIETTSTYRDGEKVAFMYIWSFCIFGVTIIGRTWNEFIIMLKHISTILDLNSEKRLIIYIHNFNFEFAFLCKYFAWEKVFAVKSRTPVYGLTSLGIEFRCSYLLSGYSLEKVAEHLQHFKLEKLKDNLDYSLVRHSKTLMSYDEILYSAADVKIVVAYIAERIEEDGGIAKIPLTKTGYVRNYCRDMCFYEKDVPKKESFKRLRYKEIINSLTLDRDEYKQLKWAFQGGFTHANAFYTDRIVNNVTSYDFTSSYPTVMISEQFPMTKGEKIAINTYEEFEENLKYYCCLFDITFYNIEAKVFYENYISKSRCWKIEKPFQINNGRVVNASSLTMTLTEQDFFIISKMYNWDHIEVKNFRRYMKDYLPKDFILSILNLYKSKTELKGVKGKEIEYLKSKEMLNSCYGMSVTDPVREEHIYTDHWLDTEEKPIPDINEKLKKYNTSPSRFLFYPWGVWVTAYARRNLFTGICEFKTDYVYSDTDSIKVVNAEKHIDYLNRYNNFITKKLEHTLQHYNIDTSMLRPKTIEGEEKPLGIWDFDGHYDRFKTLGAKRYMIEKKDCVNITVAGLNKELAVPFLLDGWYYNLKNDEYIKDPFDKFTDDLYVPSEYTGKLTHTYIDDKREGDIYDYLGKKGHYCELSSIHLEKSDYSLSLADEYIDYIFSLR